MLVTSNMKVLMPCLRVELVRFRTREDMVCRLGAVSAGQATASRLINVWCILHHAINRTTNLCTSDAVLGGCEIELMNERLRKENMIAISATYPEEKSRRISAEVTTIHIDGRENIRKSP